MWQRRIELRITEHLYNGFRFAEGIELFRPRLRVLPEAAEGLKATVRDNLGWLDALMAGKQFIVGDRFTIADIILYCALDFGSRRRTADRSEPPEPDGMVRTRRGAPERRRKSASCERTARDARLGLGREALEPAPVRA